MNERSGSELDCPLCTPAAEDVLWRDGQCRVLLVTDGGIAGYCRVVWQAHVPEMTDLADEQRRHLMSVVLGVESVVRELLQPDKINLASLGNLVPHLHWHVIPRFRDDAWFPDAIWAPARRPQPRRALDRALLVRRLGERLGGNGNPDPTGK